MLAYASRTGTRRNLNALRAAGWRLIVSPAAELRHEGFRYGLENGAWHAYQQCKIWAETPFLRAIDRLGSEADWIVVPDIVEGGARSLEFSDLWLDRLRGLERLLLPVQDGMSVGDVASVLRPGVGLFVGGSTEFKEGTMHAWGELAAQLGCYLHIGRVNTVRRIKMCAAAGAHSFDGTSVSMYAKTLNLLDLARRQPDMFPRGE